MANDLNPRVYERDANLRIAEALDKIIEDEEELANSQYIGKIVQFDVRWHSIDSNMTTINAPIVDVQLEDVLMDGYFRLMLKMSAVDPRSGNQVTIKRSIDSVKFV